MKTIVYFVLFLILIVFCGCPFCCTNEKKITPKNATVYYAGLYDYRIDPYEPYDEISKEEALSSFLSRGTSYCVGYYDEKGNLYRFEIHNKNTLTDICVDYTYYENGKLKEAKYIKPDDGRLLCVKRFDSRGKKFYDSQKESPKN